VAAAAGWEGGGRKCDVLRDVDVMCDVAMWVGEKGEKIDGLFFVISFVS
jgi:hypothetical protein